MADVTHTPHLGMTEAQQQAALEANKRAREAREKQQKEAEETVKAEREERNKINTEKMERESKYKPTPTQEESDLVASGKPLDKHEWDGSPPQGIDVEGAVAAAKSYDQPEESAWVGSKQMEAKQVEAGKSGQYKTRASKPA
jgi:hypothetical protein